ncbi:hypothetical protein H4I95_08364 [Botrytis cinerea]
MSSHTIKSDRLALEPINLDKHLHGCHKILSEPRIAEWSTRAPSTKLEETKERIMESMASVQFPMWAIMAPNASSTSVPLADEREGQEMEMIGIIGISHKPENVGYKIHPDHWVREKKSLPQIRAAYTPGNDASARVLEKVGFQTGELLRGRLSYGLIVVRIGKVIFNACT